MAWKAALLLLRVLEAVADRSLGLTDLAAQLGDDESRVRGALDALQGEGLAEVQLRERGPVFRATDAGRAALRARGVDVGTADRSLAVMFTDVVSSTELMTFGSSGDSNELRRGHFALLRKLIGEHRGREVKNLGDGIMVTFEDCDDAVACARAMTRKTARTPLKIRVGIDVGTPVREVEDYFGPTVVIASRLCNSAESGEVRISAAVRDELVRSAAQEFDPLGDLDLKGLPEPISAFTGRSS